MKRVALHLTAPQRIDIALAKALDISRAKAQKLIRDGAILVDGVVPNGHQLVINAQTVTIDESKRAPHIPATPHINTPLNILYEDADVLVINKPAGILVHPTSASTEETLVDVLKMHIPNLKAVGDDKARSGIVHRLDKDASGVMIVAKTTEAFAHLKKQFANRMNEKHYTVLVMGSVVEDSGTITFPIARSKTRARMAARPHSQDGKDAVTYFDVVQRYTHCTLLDVRIETGRTHQIRAHFYALGHPVAGDKIYLKKGIKQLPLGRLFLHARALTITLPSGERQTFNAPLPLALEDTLRNLTPTLKRFVSGIGSA